jgi:hypothetical protein
VYNFTVRPGGFEPSPEPVVYRESILDSFKYRGVAAAFDSVGIDVSKLEFVELFGRYLPVADNQYVVSPWFCRYGTIAYAKLDDCNRELEIYQYLLPHGTISNMLVYLAFCDGFDESQFENKKKRIITYTTAPKRGRVYLMAAQSKLLPDGAIVVGNMMRFMGKSMYLHCPHVVVPLFKNVTVVNF